MLDRTKKVSRWILDRWYLFFICLILVMRVFFWFSPSHAEKINLIYLWPAAIAATSLMIYARRALLPKGFLFALGMVLWLLLSCIINGDAYLTYNRSFMLGVFISFVSFLIVIPTMPAGQRTQGFSILSGVYCALMLLLAVLSLWVALTGSTFSTPFSDYSIRVSINRLFVFHYHPNEVGSAFVIGLFLLLYLAIISRNFLARLLLVLSALVICLAIALTGSRTAIMLAAGGIGAFTFWFAYICLLKQRAWVRWLIGALSMALVTVVIYLGLTMSIGAVATLATKALEQKPQATAAEAEQSPAAEAQNIIYMDESRIQLKDIGTFNMRVEIWQSGLTYLAKHPHALLFGVPDNIVAGIPATFGRIESHMHNAYLEMLLLGGIPGLLLYLGYLFVVLRSCFRLAFGQKLLLQHRFLAMVPLLIAVNGITEIYPLFSGNVMDMMFFAISGATITFAEDLYPRNRKRRLSTAL